MNYMSATKEGASIWKGLGPEEKNMWHIEADKDKLREQNEYEQLR